MLNLSESSASWEGTNSILDYDEVADMKDTLSAYSKHTSSSSSTRSSLSGSFCAADFQEAIPIQAATTGSSHSGLTPLICSRNPYVDFQAKEQLTEVLRNYILYRCSLNEHCHEADFDETALDALSRMSFLQALQTVEHFSASVSPRIQKRSAYLMGILRGQEAHWEKYVMPNHQWGSSKEISLPLRGRQILNMPAQMLLMIGQCCLQGNCLPSDFTPEVCLSLHNLPMPLAIKSVSAFNSNKRIVAGSKGGVINRARFFLRLIQNVAEQNLCHPQHNQLGGQKQQQTMVNHQKQLQAILQAKASENVQGRLLRSRSLASENKSAFLFRQSSDSKLISATQDLQTKLGPIGAPGRMTPEANPQTKFSTEPVDLNLEELADLDFSGEYNSEQVSTVERLEKEIKVRVQREEKLLLELNTAKVHLAKLQAECKKLRGVLNINRTM